jgi:hypothetical protein
MNPDEILNGAEQGDHSKARSYPGQWIEPGTDAAARAQNMLKANPTEPAVWIGQKGGDEPRVTVFGRDGRQEQISHSPIMTFPERLSELVTDWPAGGGNTQTGGDDADAAARFILGA